MKTLYLYILALLTAFAFPALADQPNPTSSWPEFVEASGCVIVDKGGYSNLASKDGGNCPYSVTLAFSGFSGTGTELIDPDGIAGNGDEYRKPNR